MSVNMHVYTQTSGNGSSISLGLFKESFPPKFLSPPFLLRYVSPHPPTGGQSLPYVFGPPPAWCLRLCGLLQRGTAHWAAHKQPKLTWHRVGG